jgi:hypothetical protein
MSFQSSQQESGARSRPRLSEGANASQIMTALRSAIPNSNQPNQQNTPRTNILANAFPTSFLQNARTNRLSEYMSMLSIPNLSTNSLTLSNRVGAQQHTSVSHVAVPAPGSSASVHPSFRSKAVCALGCRFCRKDICGRGMKAILLSDTRVELYSTDVVPPK